MQLRKKCKCGCEYIFEVDKSFKFPKTKECFKCGEKVELDFEEEKEK